MGKFGSEPVVGSIGVCAQCHNKAEVRVYPNDNPEAICEDCYRDNQKLEQKIFDKSISVQTGLGEGQQSLFQSSSGSEERDLYIRTICNKASDAWLERFIDEVVRKQVMVYDWKTIIRNERWFSILDLRRFALEVDPDLDKPVVVGARIFSPSISVPKKRGRKPRQPKELINGS